MQLLSDKTNLINNSIFKIYW